MFHAAFALQDIDVEEFHGDFPISQLACRAVARLSVVEPARLRALRFGAAAFVLASLCKSAVIMSGLSLFQVPKTISMEIAHPFGGCKNRCLTPGLTRGKFGFKLRLTKPHSQCAASGHGRSNCPVRARVRPPAALVVSTLVQPLARHPLAIPPAAST